MIRVRVMENPALHVRLGQDSALAVGVSPIIRAAPEGLVHYKGPYSVTPKVEAQTLATAEKYMDGDVTVHAVPFYAVSNDRGGNTVYIAKEI